MDELLCRQHIRLQERRKQSLHTMKDEREALLDRYPVNEIELDCLLTLYESVNDSFFENADNDDDTLESAFIEQQELLPELPKIFQREVQDVFIVGISPEEHQLYNKAKLVEAAVTLTGRRGSPKMGDKIFSSAANPMEKGDTVPVQLLADFIHRLALAAYRLEYPDDDALSQNQHHAFWLHSIAASSAQANVSSVSRIEWNNWVETTGFQVPLLLSTVFHYTLLGAPIERPLFPWTRGPDEQQPTTSFFWSHALEPIPLQLSMMGLGGPWMQASRRLYSSEENGLAFATFSAALLAFCGPTLVLIRTTRGETLGFYTELAWKKGPNWYTDDNDDNNDDNTMCSSFLFRLGPFWNAYHKTIPENSEVVTTPWSNKKYCFHQYLHTPASYKRVKGALTGLAMGGIAADAPRLHITTTLENCTAGSMDRTFQAGPLLDDDGTLFFDVDAMEVWAIRSDHFQEAVAAGRLNASVREATRIQVAQVDKAQFVDDFASGAIMNNSFHHRQYTSGRAEYKTIGTNSEGFPK
jgi:hypothetical protein